ncbi:unnamed protein product [Diplocarpon coronariae]
MNPLANKFQPETSEAAIAPHRNHMNGSPRDGFEVLTESLRNASIEGKSSPKRCKSGSQKPQWEKNVSAAVSAHRNDITPPSKKSGGIPEPTPEYLAASLLPSELLKEAQHLLVVIDLNGTLLFRPKNRNPSSFTARPNTARFLKYCLDTFTVVIWSSARPANVNLMCNKILNASTKKKVVDIWARDKFNLTVEDYNLRTMCYKRLTSLWNDPKIAASHPEFQLGERWNLLIDDSPEKGRSEPYNLIAVPQFSGDAYEQGQILPQVHDYLNILSLHSNVAAYLRARPFQAVLPDATPPTHLEGLRQFRSSLDPSADPARSVGKGNCGFNSAAFGFNI